MRVQVPPVPPLFEIAMLKVYKIRKKGTTDLFSSGGAYPRWTKKGKTWGSLAHVTSHLGNRRAGDYADGEIVVFKVVEDDVLDLDLVVKQIRERHAAKVAKAEADRTKRKEAQERAQLQALQAKYPQ